MGSRAAQQGSVALRCVALFMTNVYVRTWSRAQHSLSMSAFTAWYSSTCEVCINDSKSDIWRLRASSLLNLVLSGSRRWFVSVRLYRQCQTSCMW